MTDGSVSVKASLDDKNYVAGMDALIRKVDKAELKLKEFNVEGKRGEGILNSLGMLAGGLGGALVTAMTAGVAASPQFKAFLGELSVPFFELTEFLGNKFEPLFDRIVPLVEEFVDTVINSDFVNDSLDDFIGTVDGLITLLKNLKTAYDNLPEGVKSGVETFVKAALNPGSIPGMTQDFVGGTMDYVGKGFGLEQRVIDQNKDMYGRGKELTGDLLRFDLGEFKRDMNEVTTIIGESFRREFKWMGLFG